MTNADRTRNMTDSQLAEFYTKCGVIQLRLIIVLKIARIVNLQVITV